MSDPVKFGSMWRVILFVLFYPHGGLFYGESDFI